MRTLIIDIGTHKAEELKVLSGNFDFLFSKYVAWWLDWFKRRIKVLIRYNGLIEYGTGAFVASPTQVGLRAHKRYVEQMVWPTNYLRHTHILAIDPVSEISAKETVKIPTENAIRFLPLAILPHIESESFKVTEFFIEKNSLSSSLSRSQSHLTSVYCGAVSFQALLNQLKRIEFIQPSDRLILRMNCEGSELAVLQGLVAEGVTASIVMGSLNDVRKKFGEADAAKMEALIATMPTTFRYFKGSDPSTWMSAFEAMESLNETSRL